MSPDCKTASAGRLRPRMQAAGAALALLLGWPAHAQTQTESSPEPEPPALRLSGFATLGLTHNDNATAGAITSFSQTRPVQRGWSANMDSVLGLQLDWQARPGTSVLLQGVARAGEDMRPQLRSAYLRQELAEGLSTRLGRLRSPLYFDSDIAEIGYANLAVRPPLPLYGMVNSVASLDGGDLQWQRNVGNASLRLQAYAGGYDYKHRFNNLDPVLSADARLRQVRGLALSANLPDLVLRFSRTEIGQYTMRSAQVDQINSALTQLAGALTQVASNPLLPSTVAAGLLAKAQALPALSNPFDNRPIYTSLGLDANLQDWRVMAELTEMDSRAALVGKYRGQSLTVARSFDVYTPYVVIARQRRHGPRLDTSALAATGLDTQLDAGLTQLRAGLDLAQQFADLSTRSLSLGLRWDWRENMALKLQLDELRTPGSSTPGALAVRSLPFDNKVRLFSVTLDLVF